MVRKSDRPPEKNNLNERLAAIAKRVPGDSASDAINPRPGTGRTLRRLVFRNATVEFSSGARLTVVAKNLSETGARIEFVAHATLPELVLFIEPTANLRRQARVVWQRGGAAGIEFVD
jgi:hypothetical protein